MDRQVRQIFLLLLVGSIDGLCEKGWFSRGLHCYYINETPATFQAAEDSCRQSHAHLVNIEDQAENDLIFSEAMKVAQDYYWIGYELIIKDTWRWTASGRVGSYFNWGYGEPDAEGDCARLTPFYEGFWRDHPCSESSKFVCKKLADCGMLIEMKNTKRSVDPIPSSSENLFYPAQSKATYTCNKNFEFIDKRTSKSYVCELGGVWKPEMSADEQCYLKSCSPPPQFKHATSNVTTDDYFNIGTVIAYICEDAYWFSEKANVRYKYLQCQPNQTWVGDDVGDCSRMYCIRPVTRNSVANSSSNTFGTIARYQCNRGYMFKDGNTSKVFTCKQTWDPKPELCYIKNCSDYSVVNASASTTSVSYGTLVTWTCNAGLQFPDTSTRKTTYCTESLTWKPRITEKCEAKSCKNAPPNATELYTHNWNPNKTYKYLDELDYECVHEGWTFPSKDPQRIRKVVCGKDTEWTPKTIGECTGEPIVVHTEHSTKTPKESKNAQVIGYLGWMVAGGLLLCIVVLDVTTIGRHLAMMKNNLCPPNDIEKDPFIAKKVQQWKKAVKKKPKTVIRHKPATIEDINEEETMSKLEKSKRGSRQSLTLSHSSGTQRSTAA